jgi:NhaC family Na+:H+ antiporter
LFKNVYKENGYESRLLSRSLEDGATVTSPLVPWSTCGMTHSTILGVSTFMYFPYCFFCYISPIMSIIIAALGYKIFRNGKKLNAKEATA